MQRNNQLSTTLSGKSECHALPGQKFPETRYIARLLNNSKSNYKKLSRTNNKNLRKKLFIRYIHINEEV